MSSPLFWELCGAIIRWALAVLGAWMVEKHIITADQSEAYVKAFTHDLLLAMPMIAAIAWSVIAKYRTRIKFLAALSMTNLATENEVNAKVKSGALTPSVSTPPDTVPGVPCS